MIEADRFPVFFLVAGLALRPERFLMLVVFLVTADTSQWELFFLFFHLRLVAGIALGRDMLAQQRKFSVLVVIEFGDLPFFLVMAGFTFRAQATFMDIVLAVTANTRSRRLFLFGVERSLMTTDAFHRLVLA